MDRWSWGCQIKKDHVQAFDEKWYDVLSAVTDISTHNMLEIPYKMQIEESEELKCVANIRSRVDVRRQEIRPLQTEVYGPKTSRGENQRFSFQTDKIETRTDSKNDSERGDCRRWIMKGQCSCRDSCAVKHEPNKKRQRKGTTSFTFSDKLTAPKFERWRKGWWWRNCKRHTQNELVKSSGGKIRVIIGMFLHVQSSNFQPDASSETSVFANTQCQICW